MQLVSISQCVDLCSVVSSVPCKALLSFTRMSCSVFFAGIEKLDPLETYGRLISPWTSSKEIKNSDLDGVVTAFGEEHSKFPTGKDAVVRLLAMYGADLVVHRESEEIASEVSDFFRLMAQFHINKVELPRQITQPLDKLSKACDLLRNMFFFHLLPWL